MAAETDWAYLAGIIDGEGTISLYKEGQRYSIPTLTVRVSSTDENLMTWLRRNFGGSYNKRKTKQKSTHKDSYTWSLYGKKLNIILHNILPYLQIKYIQAVMGLEFRRTVSSPEHNGRKIPEHIKIYRNLLCDLFREANKRGSQ